MDEAFRARVRGGERLLGVFVKTASHQAVELVARTGVDFAIVDAEHAPFDLLTLDRMAAVARAAGLPLLVRPVDLSPGFIGQVLDMGFAGVVAPHVDSGEAARRLLGAARYGRGERGFSPSTRAAGWGALDSGVYRAAADAGTTLMGQVEDIGSLARLDEIAAEDLDALFIGRADLAASLGVTRPDDPAVGDAVREITAAAARAQRPSAIFVGGVGEIPALAALGIRIFVCGSDQSWLLAEGRRLRAAFDS